MSLSKNLNDIPFQFRQYENNNNNKNTNEDISDKKIKIEPKSLIKSDGKKEIKTLNSNCHISQINKKDKFFILLILAIFFDVL